ncbi:MAG: hypothetical protein ABR970_20395, partial [Roseiarcus sp.]
MDDFIVLGLIGLVFLLLGPIGFFLALGARARLGIVEARLAELTAAMAPAPAERFAAIDQDADRRLAAAQPLAPRAEPPAVAAEVPQAPSA